MKSPFVSHRFGPLHRPRIPMEQKEFSINLVLSNLFPPPHNTTMLMKETKISTLQLVLTVSHCYSSYTLFSDYILWSIVLAFVYGFTNFN
jgi:hypothetical protein